MFKRELKVNFKSFFIWLLILVLMFLLVFFMYPFIVDGENKQLMEQMMEMFPEEVLKMFNMDVSSIDSAYGWLKSEGLVFILLVVGCYSGVLGATILVKEENDKTIEYLNSLPIKRDCVVLSKIKASLVYISSMIIILGLFNFVCLQLSGDFDKKQYLLLSLTPFLSCFVIFFVCMFLSTFTHKTKKMIGVSLGIVFISYMFQVFSQLSDSVSFFKYFSVFTLSDVRNVILEKSINPVMICTSLVLCGVLFVLTIYRYRRKELV